MKWTFGLLCAAGMATLPTVSFAQFTEGSNYAITRAPEAKSKGFHVPEDVPDRGSVERYKSKVTLSLYFYPETGDPLFVTLRVKDDKTKSSADVCSFSTKELEEIGTLSLLSEKVRRAGGAYFFMCSWSHSTDFKSISFDQLNDEPIVYSRGQECIFLDVASVDG